MRRVTGAQHIHLSLCARGGYVEYFATFGFVERRSTLEPSPLLNVAAHDLQYESVIRPATRKDELLSAGNGSADFGQLGKCGAQARLVRPR